MFLQYVKQICIFVTWTQLCVTIRQLEAGPLTGQATIVRGWIGTCSVPSPVTAAAGL